MDNNFNNSNINDGNMKAKQIKIAVAAGAILIVFLCVFFNMPSRKIVGSWEDESGFTITFDSDGYVHTSSGDSWQYSIKNGKLRLSGYGEITTSLIKFEGRNKMKLSELDGSFEEEYVRK